MNKQIALQSISGMPKKFDLEDLIERLLLLDKIEKGRQDVKNKEIYSHDEAKKRLSKWIK